MQWFEYPCPSCNSTNAIHTKSCDHVNKNREQIESAYFDIILPILTGTKTAEEFRNGDLISNGPSENDHWTGLHEDCLTILNESKRIIDRGNGYVFLTQDEWADEMSKPGFEPMKTIYEKGSYPGCHDNSTFAMIAYYEMVGLSWEETKEQVINWIHESGTWDRGGFAESSPEELIDSKYHVFESGYGWKEKAKAAKKVIDSQS